MITLPRAKTKKYQKKSYESTGVSSDVFAQIYQSMLTHPAWMALTPHAQRLYMYCKLQVYSQKRKPCTNKYPEYGNERYFYFNKWLWCETYKLYSEANQASFYRDRDLLISHGFIAIVEGGFTTREKIIYRFSSMWQKWDTPHFKIEANEKSVSMLRKERKKAAEQSVPS